MSEKKRGAKLGILSVMLAATKEYIALVSNEKEADVVDRVVLSLEALTKDITGGDHE